MIGKLRVGTCSWRFPSWQGLVYPVANGINYLEHYARRYDTVEVDRWFWSLFGEGSVGLPEPADVGEYRRSVPDDFVFTVKAPNSVTLTHYYRKKRSDPLVENPNFLSPSLLCTFLSRLSPLGDTLGPVMLQFEYLNRQKMASQGRFLDVLSAFVEELPRGYRLGLEIRNPKYLGESLFEFMLRYQLVPVLLEGYWMPAVTDVYEDWRSLLCPHKEIVVRLLGRDRQGMEKQTGKQWNRIVAPEDEQLAAIVEMVEDLVAAGVDVYLNVNNHYEGSAPLTIERIRGMLAG